MKAKFIWIIAIVAILIAGFITNPSETKHKEALKETVRAGLSKALQMNGVKQGNQFHEVITDRFYEDIIWQELLAGSVTRKNYLFFSTSQITYLNKTYTAGFGAFGYVFVFKEVERQVSNKLNELIQQGGGLKSTLGF